MIPWGHTLVTDGMYSAMRDLSTVKNYKVAIGLITQGKARVRCVWVYQ